MLRPARRWPTAMLGPGGAAAARLTRCHGRQSADLLCVWPLFGLFTGLSDLPYVVVSTYECVFSSCCLIVSLYVIPNAKKRASRRFPRDAGPNGRRHRVRPMCDLECVGANSCAFMCKSDDL